VILILQTALKRLNNLQESYSIFLYQVSVFKNNASAKAWSVMCYSVIAWLSS